MITLLQVSEHAPRIIEAARPLADTDRGLVLGVILLLAVLIVGGFILAGMALRRMRKAAPDAQEVSAGLQALSRLPDALEKGLERLEGKIDTLTQRVDAQGESMPSRVAGEIVDRTIRWRGQTPSRGMAPVTEEEARAHLLASGEG